MGDLLAPKEVAEERYAICKNCEHFVNLVKVCDICKCFMPAKTKLANVNCPQGIWKAYQSVPTQGIDKEFQKKEIEETKWGQWNK